MKPIEPLPFRQRADIFRTEKFVAVEPRSGNMRVLREDEGYVIYLPPQPDDEALGRALLEALDRSRFIRSAANERRFFEEDRIKQSEQKWHDEVMGRYGYKSKRALYKSMNWVRARRMEGVISFTPHDRRTPGTWRWLPPDKTIVIPETRDAVVAGTALRRGLDQCDSE
jgi:hypothetical protein